MTPTQAIKTLTIPEGCTADEYKEYAAALMSKANKPRLTIIK